MGKTTGWETAPDRDLGPFHRGIVARDFKSARSLIDEACRGLGIRWSKGVRDALAAAAVAMTSGTVHQDHIRVHWTHKKHKNISIFMRDCRGGREVVDKDS
jgi:hypothetical protein